MTTVESPRIAYVMKRYPRLTETFILNEITVMERLDVRLELFSLLQPEPPPHHPTVKEVKAQLHCLPATYFAKLKKLAQTHGCCVATSPMGYLRALGRAFSLSIASGDPINVWKKFLWAGFVADGCRRRNVALIHAHFANTPAAVAWFASAMSGIPYSFTTHAKDLYLTAPRTMRMRARKAKFIATCTRYNADYLKTILAEGDHGKIHVVYHGVDACRFVMRSDATSRPAYGRPPLVLSVGRLVPKKGLNDLIAACQALHRDGIHFRCVIVGEGPLRGALEADIARRGLAGIVTLVGAMTHADLVAFYGEADVFVLSPRIVADGDRDGIPNVIVEAMAAGVPVISTSVSGIPEVVRNNITGLLVPSETPAALAAALRRLLGDPQYGAKLASNARARVARDFDCRETTKVLRDLMCNCACDSTQSREDVDTFSTYADKSPIEPAAAVAE
ncbi:MAG: glycosyltransferase [Alphaproteobacteria bacterium]|nr:glycosyltransferase [Alphaproteobacteria bacterium]